MTTDSPIGRPAPVKDTVKGLLNPEVVAALGEEGALALLVAAVRTMNELGMCMGLLGSGTHCPNEPVYTWRIFGPDDDDSRVAEVGLCADCTARRRQQIEECGCGQPHRYEVRSIQQAG